MVSPKPKPIRPLLNLTKPFKMGAWVLIIATATLVSIFSLLKVKGLGEHAVYFNGLETFGLFLGQSIGQQTN